MAFFRKSYTVHHDLAKSGLGQWGTIEPGGYTFNARIFALPSRFGIDDGRISKLEIKNSRGEVVLHYDRGFELDERGREMKLSGEQKALIGAMQKEFAVGKPWSPEQLAVLKAAEKRQEEAQAEWEAQLARQPARPFSNPMGFFEKKNDLPRLFAKEPQEDIDKPADAKKQQPSILKPQKDAPPASVEQTYTPDLTRPFKVINPDDLEKRRNNVADADNVRETATCKPAKANSNSDLEFDINGADAGSYSDYFVGTITSQSDPAINYDWSLTEQRRPTTECIEGTTISSLHVANNQDGKTALSFEGGRWQKQSPDQTATAIREKFIEQYADDRPREMHLSEEEHHSMPIGLTQEERQAFFKTVEAKRAANTENAPNKDEAGSELREAHDASCRGADKDVADAAGMTTDQWDDHVKQTRANRATRDAAEEMEDEQER